MTADKGQTPLPLIEWLTERLENCQILAAKKVGEDRAGWLEDAEYFHAAVATVAERDKQLAAANERAESERTRAIVLNGRAETAEADAQNKHEHYQFELDRANKAEAECERSRVDIAYERDRNLEKVNAARDECERLREDAERYRIGGHGNCINAQGYELGMAWVKFENGRVISVLWTTDAEVDAAIAALKADGGEGK